MLEALHIPTCKHTSLLQQTVLASAKAFHLLHMCWHKNRKSATASLQHKRREYSKETWGKAPPPIPTAKAT